MGRVEKIGWRDHVPHVSIWELRSGCSRLQRRFDEFKKGSRKGLERGVVALVAGGLWRVKGKEKRAQLAAPFGAAGAAGKFVIGLSRPSDYR